MVWSNCIISRACAQQAIILFLKWNENSEIFIEKCWKQTKKSDIKKTLNFHGVMESSGSVVVRKNRLPPANVARVRFPDSASYVGWVLYNLLQG